MKIFGLTIGQFGTALLLAGCIACIYTFAAMPHPVEVPKIVITPVPTPPPVVITEEPTQAPAEPKETLSQPLLKETMEIIESNMDSAVNMVLALMLLMIVSFPIMLLIRIINKVP